MDAKVLLVLIDGLRSDAIDACGSSSARWLLERSVYALDGRTVMPSVTLPCHMSLFHSVPPERHGVVTNVFTPMVRPLNGLVEQLSLAGKRCAFFYTWAELRDLCRPDGLVHSELINLHYNNRSDDQIADAARDFILSDAPDFAFLYLGQTDESGHDSGWMTEPYLKTVTNAFDCVRRVREAIPAGYDMIVTADHGGHDRSHGTDQPSDMTIPLILNGPSFAPEMKLAQPSILDIAPTVAKLLGAQPAREWEGAPLL